MNYNVTWNGHEYKISEKLNYNVTWNGHEYKISEKFQSIRGVAVLNIYDGSTLLD